MTCALSLRTLLVLLVITLASTVLFGTPSQGLVAFTAMDPGVRRGLGGSGPPLGGITPAERQFFEVGHSVFRESFSVRGTIPGTRPGLGPRFNADSCTSCHSQPHQGGTSPAINPMFEIASKEGAINEIPPFITKNGPIREMRIKTRDDDRDPGVQSLFTITGRSDAGGCSLQQPDFRLAGAMNMLAFRIPTPMFGAGLIEAIDDETILLNLQATLPQRQSLGITGHPNLSDNDGTITRFGWKAQNKSIEIFVAEALNVEMGVTSELFAHERGDNARCRLNLMPEAPTHVELTSPSGVSSDSVTAAFFVRFLAPPVAAPQDISTTRGRMLFQDTGCAACHTQSLHTGNSVHPVLRAQEVNLFSDLLLHHMGPGLADGIRQGRAKGDEFRTAPLWGLGERIFFLHDGRTMNLLHAIEAHASRGDGYYTDSEANEVVARFFRLSEMDKQHVLNFLRSL